MFTKDKASMTKLTLAIDKAIGYYPSTSASIFHDSRPEDVTMSVRAPDQPDQSLLTHLPTESLLDIQERWIDYPESYEVHQQEKWAEEGEWVAQKATQASHADAIQRNRADQCS